MSDFIEAQRIELNVPAQHSFALNASSQHCFALDVSILYRTTSHLPSLYPTLLIERV